MKRIVLLVMSVLICIMADAQIVQSNMSRQIVQPAAAKKGYFKTGYRGFIEAGIGAGFNSKIDEEYVNLSISTIHGCELFRHLFVGLGVGVQGFIVPDDEDTTNKNKEKETETETESYASFPIFSDVRFDFLNRTISPFLDMQLGGTVGDFEGVHFALSAGCRFSHFNLSMGYALQNYTYDNGSLRLYSVKETRAINSFMIRLAVDWGARL